MTQKNRNPVTSFYNRPNRLQFNNLQIVDFTCIYPANSEIKIMPHSRTSQNNIS